MRQHAITKRRNPWWGSLTWLLALAFALQSYVTQTHIHGVSEPTAHAITIDGIGKATSPIDTPTGKRTADCPLCQAIGNAGAFLTPIIPLVFMLAQSFERVPSRNDHYLLGTAIAHNWRSRAPPQN